MDVVQFPLNQHKTVDKISEHRSIIGFRHVLVHGYDSLDPDTVWNVVETKIEVLLKQAGELLPKM